MLKSQSPETVELWLPDANKTDICGASLNSTLYNFPCTVYLSGELGAGKTTFVQGLARGMGIAGPLTSPTFALEQRYEGAGGHPFLHLDLYRLKDDEARTLVASTDDFEGLRCIEWAEKLGNDHRTGIHVALEEQGAGRRITIEFNDVPLPSDAHILEWRADVHLPAHIADHCEGVAEVALACAEDLLARGIVVRKRMTGVSGRLHDLFRFIDFGDLAEHPAYPRWKEIKASFGTLKHEAACARFLQEQGYDALARVIEVHGLRLPSPQRTTIEQKLLFYADKRVALDKVVSLQERFDDFAKRYGRSMETDRSEIWYEEAIQIERELFPDGPPV